MAVQRLHVEKRFSEIAISGNLVHLAGQLASDTSLDIQGQTQQTLDIIDRFLADAGQVKTKIMPVTIYLKDIEKDYAWFKEIGVAWVGDIQALLGTFLKAKLNAQE